MPSGWSSRPAASTSDQRTLDAAVARMEQMAFDDFEQRHPPSAALDYLLYDVVCDPIPDDDEARFGQTGVDHLVAHADPDLPAGPARWVRLVVGLTAAATLSPGLLRSISAHAPSCCATAFRPLSGSGTSPGNSNPRYSHGF
jgi:hypothetical protein